MFRNISRCYLHRKTFTVSNGMRYYSELKPVESKEPTSNISTSDPNMKSSDLNTVVPTEWHKTILVFSGKYKSKADIPSRVSPGVLDNAQSKVRIKVANILMGLLLVACFIASYWGKKRRERGESINQIMLDKKTESLKKYES